MRGHPRILCVLAADVHVNALAPVATVADAPAVVGREDHIALLEQILVKAVVDGVVALHVPAVVALIHAVAVNPHDRRMRARSIEVLRYEQPTRYRLTIRAGIV